jgi:hypothetical protein
LFDSGKRIEADDEAPHERAGSGCRKHIWSAAPEGAFACGFDFEFTTPSRERHVRGGRMILATAHGGHL